MEVPAGNLIGKIGDGAHYAFGVLDVGRLGLAAATLGAAKDSIDRCVQYAGQREAFGRKIQDFQAIQFMLAEMAAETYAMENMVYRTAWMCDQGMRFSRESAIVHLNGGMGYSAEMWPESFYRDSRINRIFEGTNEIQRVVIARDVLKKGGY